MSNSNVFMNNINSCSDRVDTTSRLAQWRVDDFSGPSNLKSKYFKIGGWDWNLIIEKIEKIVGHFGAPRSECFIILKPEYHGEGLLIASFNMRVVSLVEGRRILLYTEIRDKRLKKTEGVRCALTVPLTRRFIIDVEFLDLKTASLNGGEPRSVWSERCIQNVAATSALGRMLSESIHTDIIISASNGSIGAHRAVLAASSPVFDSMFTHDLKEKELSVINIPDMCIEVCQTFLSYLYSNNIQYQDFLSHRLSLLRAADKYDVTNLKDACQESLLEDIDSANVLERLQIAVTYRLPRLKDGCFKYLVNFGKIFDIKEEFDAFIQSTDRELVSEVVNEILSVWKGV
ncbi:BTB/POZ domain-containing protein [Artemisia annua]|uniref:BTB/POZ domain-containing protein n=1 Tax=Artemisia annua TaxID=35608 RepID=A0A2U1LTK8_ARTAN|nr:BTB/POZ domain-containing protein [Artemisia annua]